MSLIFMAVDVDFIGIRSWGYWLFIPAFFILIGAISGLLTDRRLKKTMLATAIDKGSTSVSLETLSAETDIRAEDVLRVLIDLRNDGLVKYRYDSNNGEVVFGEGVNYLQSSEFAGPMTKRQAAEYVPTDVTYCPYCGHKPPIGAQFCESCGSKL
ncbi:MAG: zinc ribbon domain-containing protein [Candidatus Heimdallarchaeaceae archaeon]